MAFFLLALLGVGAYVLMKSGSPAPTPAPPAPGASIMTITTGHWYQVSLKITPTPPTIAAPPLAAMQQQFDSEFPGLLHVASVTTSGQDTIVAVVQALGTKQLPLPFQPVSFEGITVTPSVVEVSPPQAPPTPGPQLPPLPAPLGGPPPAPPTPPGGVPPLGGGVAAPIATGTLDVFYAVPGTAAWKAFCTSFTPVASMAASAMLICKFPDSGNALSMYLSQQIDSGIATFAMLFQRNDADPTQSQLVVWPWGSPRMPGPQVAMQMAPRWGAPMTFVTDATAASTSLQSAVAAMTQTQQGLPQMPNPDHVFWYARRTPPPASPFAHGVMPMQVAP